MLCVCRVLYCLRGEKMRVVVYADILFVLNAYLTYALLLVTDLLCRAKGSRLRRALAALLGGAYAFVIFVPKLPGFVLALSRLAAAAVFLLAAYGKSGLKRFLLLYGGFFAVNFVFAGLMFALWHTLRPKSLLCFGSVVYFNIDTLLLVTLTAVCYAVFYGIHRLLEARPPRRSLFRLTVTLGGKSARCTAFLDSGNRLQEPFSGLPAIVVEKRVLAPLLGEADLSDAETAARLHLRQIPCRVLTGEGTLPGFRPDEIVIRSAQEALRTGDVYVAISETPLCGGDYGALLHPNLMEETNVILCKK